MWGWSAQAGAAASRKARARASALLTRLGSSPSFLRRSPSTSFPPLSPSKQIDCAQACADREGCASYQYCGYGSYDDTCLYVTAPEGTAPGTTQAGKGDCFLGSGHWRQVPTDKPFGGWTVGIACSSYAADPAPVAAEGEEGGGEPADAAAVPVVAAPVAIAAKKPAAAAAAPKKPLEEKAAEAPAPAAAPAKKAAPAPAGSPAWAAALPPSPVKAMTVPTAVTKVATAAQPELKVASIPEA